MYLRTRIIESQKKRVDAMRHVKGLSPAVTVALIILVSIAVVAALWLYSQRLTSGGNLVQAQANLITNRYVNNRPVHVIDISVQSKAQTRLQLTDIIIVGTMSDGSTVTGNVTKGINGYTITVKPGVNDQYAYVQPNSEKHFTITMTGGGNNSNPLVEVSFQLVFKDDAGNTYTVQTNSITLG
jgi:hypothetical protein